MALLENKPEIHSSLWKSKVCVDDIEHIKLKYTNNRCVLVIETKHGEYISPEFDSKIASDVINTAISHIRKSNSLDMDSAVYYESKKEKEGKKE